MAVWKRQKSSPAVNSGTTIAVTFDEGSAVDSTHTLVAVVEASGSSAPTTPSGWTLASGSTNYGSTMWLGMFIRQGDGSTNGITVVFGASQTQLSATLFAFEGYVTTALDHTPVASNNAASTSQTVGPSTATTATNTIAIAAVGLQSGGGGTWGSFDAGYESIPSSLSRLHVGVKAATSAGAVHPPTTVTWTSSRGNRDIVWVIQGTVPATNVLPTVEIGTVPDSYVGDTIAATATAADTDGSITSYSWTVLDCDVTAPTLSGATTATVSFVADRPMTVTLRCAVLDNLGGSAFADETVVVTIERKLPTDKGPRRWSQRNRGTVAGSAGRMLQYRGDDSTEIGKIAEWNFQEPSAPFATVDGAFPLSAVGSVPRVTSPWGYAVDIDGPPNYLRMLAADFGGLNMGRFTGKVTVACWVNRQETDTGFIAGAWQEDSADPRRQYGLFIDLGSYGGGERGCFHVSKLGGPTPPLAFSRDYSATGNLVTNSVWQFHVGTYDGAEARSYLNGVFTPYEDFTDTEGLTYDKNPYAYPDGLNATPCEFTVGAVKLTAGMGNFFNGQIAKLRVWDRALTPAEIARLYAAEVGAI